MTPRGSLAPAKKPRISIGRGCRRCRACGFTGTPKEVLVHEDAEHSVLPVHACVKCGYLAWSAFLLDVHKRHTHGASDLPITTCVICAEFFTTPKEHDDHVRKKHTDSQIIFCKFCGVMYRNKDALAKHVRTKHADLYRFCPQNGCDVLCRSHDVAQKHCEHAHGWSLQSTFPPADGPVIVANHGSSIQGTNGQVQSHSLHIQTVQNGQLREYSTPRPTTNGIVHSCSGALAETVPVSGDFANSRNGSGIQPNRMRVSDVQLDTQCLRSGGQGANSNEMQPAAQILTSSGAWSTQNGRYGHPTVSNAHSLVNSSVVQEEVSIDGGSANDRPESIQYSVHPSAEPFTESTTEKDHAKIPFEKASLQKEVQASGASSPSAQTVIGWGSNSGVSNPAMGVEGKDERRPVLLSAQVGAEARAMRREIIRKNRRKRTISQVGEVSERQGCLEMQGNPQVHGGPQIDDHSQGNDKSKVLRSSEMNNPGQVNANLDLARDSAVRSGSEVNPSFVTRDNNMPSSNMQSPLSALPTLGTNLPHLKDNNASQYAIVQEQKEVREFSGAHGNSGATKGLPIHYITDLRHNSQTTCDLDIRESSEKPPSPSARNSSHTCEDPLLARKEKTHTPARSLKKDISKSKSLVSNKKPPSSRNKPAGKRKSPQNRRKSSLSSQQNTSPESRQASPSESSTERQKNPDTVDFGTLSANTNAQRVSKSGSEEASSVVAPPPTCKPSRIAIPRSAPAGDRNRIAEQLPRSGSSATPPHVQTRPFPSEQHRPPYEQPSWRDSFKNSNYDAHLLSASGALPPMSTIDNRHPGNVTYSQGPNHLGSHHITSDWTKSHAQGWAIVPSSSTPLYQNIPSRAHQNMLAASTQPAHTLPSRVHSHAHPSQHHQLLAHQSPYQALQHQHSQNQMPEHPQSRNSNSVMTAALVSYHIPQASAAMAMSGESSYPQMQRSATEACRASTFAPHATSELPVWLGSHSQNTQSGGVTSHAASNGRGPMQQSFVDRRIRSPSPQMHSTQQHSVPENTHDPRMEVHAKSHGRRPGLAASNDGSLKPGRLSIAGLLSPRSQGLNDEKMYGDNSGDA